MKSSKVNIHGYIAHSMLQTYGQYSIKYIFGGSKLLFFFFLNNLGGFELVQLQH